MNELTTSVTSSQHIVVGPASSKGAVVGHSEIGSKKLPELTETRESNTTADSKLVEPKGLEEAIATINDYVQSIQRDLQFSVDEELDKTVVKVVDSHSGEVIRQIPDAVFMELARKLQDEGELQLVNAFG